MARLALTIAGGIAGALLAPFGGVALGWAIGGPDGLPTISADECISLMEGEENATEPSAPSGSAEI